ncbi:hypothetical protein IEQ34_019494 [Dendrobium chrysotoxum]|uniref:VWFA domain-containing protein n=1 Tax=Dendrobium chrysotoxum TaxID=161865 RepID=A0AAV7G8U1_DENCH|nr:hypothetical protein IEQ34_019494 [Dendrobium chrysotoxum]
MTPYSVPQPPATRKTRKLDLRYSQKSDNYNSLEQVTEALVHAGLEYLNLIVGIDFTKSNEWTGKFSFHNRSLHHISDTQNPYEHAISIIGQTLSTFDEDNLIPCYGFGDASTHDQDVFSFFPDERPCTGLSEALSRYREIVPHLRLAGPKSFAPIIEKAMTIVEQSGGQFHVLLIIADGQAAYMTSQEQKTVDAIVKASEFPLSIVLVGVGDGPWDMMKEFDDNIPDRPFDNFQFVNFTEIMSKNTHQKRKDTDFGLAAIMELHSQYKATIELGILGKSARSPQRVVLPPPDGSRAAAAFGSKSFQSTCFQKSSTPYTAYDSPTNYAPSASSASWEQVTEALARAGLESANLIVGIDFTEGNERTGKFSVHNRSLHHISDIPNLYEHAISIIGQTLSAFEEDNLIPCYGFGDASTHDQDVFSSFPVEKPCTGLEALSRYKEIFKHSRLAGPASFAQIIKKAMTVVEQSGGQYHVLLIIADGQITESLVTQSGYLSSQDQKTVDAIVKASEFPLSIVLVGVGDGPWDMIKKFDDKFQFVNFTEIMSKNTHQKRKETEFALAALIKIPSQYKATIELGILGKSARSPQRVALPQPDGSRAAAAFGSKSFQSISFQKSSPSYTAYDSPTSYDPSAPSLSDMPNGAKKSGLRMWASGSFLYMLLHTKLLFSKLEFLKTAFDKNKVTSNKKVYDDYKKSLKNFPKFDITRNYMGRNSKEEKKFNNNEGRKWYGKKKV